MIHIVAFITENYFSSWPTILAFKNVSTYSYATTNGYTLRQHFTQMFMMILKTQPTRVHVTMQLSSKNKQRWFLLQRNFEHIARFRLYANRRAALLKSEPFASVGVIDFNGCFNH